MPCIAYTNKNFQGRTRVVIDQANEILAEYEGSGISLTLRSLYYQFVARGLLENTERNYQRLGSILNDARMAGELDWDAITDRTRNLASLSAWNSPRDIIDACSKQFRLDLWEDQPYYVEVWIEKDALVGVIERPCQDNRVPYFSCRGYTSQSEMWGAAQRLGEKIAQGKKVRILHFGDHDPSGIDMTRDITERLQEFIAKDLLAERHEFMSEDGAEYLIDRLSTFASARALQDHLQIERMALNWEQVETYNPPPNPAKLTDSRAHGYVAKFGESSWELDALEPRLLANLVRTRIEHYRDVDKWQEARLRENTDKKRLKAVTKHWSEVSNAALRAEEDNA